ncbi:hypothetical protein FRB90_012398 [Tulasnella sp. 427]|nr:hypothetical protein FRB90_012398 [Tulasnella sp. 427]
MTLSKALSLQNYHRSRTRLLLVCHTWANVIKENPSIFWTTLTTSDPRTQFARLIQMCGQRPITLFLDSRGGHSDYTTKIWKSLKSAKLVLGELVIQDWNIKRLDRPLAECLAVSAQHLRSFELTAGVEPWQIAEGKASLALLFRAWAETAPKLKSVRLCGVAIPWSSAILRGLHALTLENPEGWPGSYVTLGAVLQILGDYPALAYLTLDLGRPHQTETLSKMKLNQLMVPKLRAQYSTLMLDALRHITFPSTTITSLRVDKARTGYNDVSSVMSLAHQKLAPEALQLKLAHRSLALSQLDFNLVVPDDARKPGSLIVTPYKEIFSELGRPCQSSITSLDLDSSACADSSSILTAASEFLPNVV